MKMVNPPGDSWMSCAANPFARKDSSPLLSLVSCWTCWTSSCFLLLLASSRTLTCAWDPSCCWTSSKMALGWATWTWFASRLLTRGYQSWIHHCWGYRFLRGRFASWSFLACCLKSDGLPFLYCWISSLFLSSHPHHRRKGARQWAPRSALSLSGAFPRCLGLCRQKAQRMGHCLGRPSWHGGF
jgi:hypothetical protein